MSTSTCEVTSRGRSRPTVREEKTNWRRPSGGVRARARREGASLSLALVAAARDGHAGQAEPSDHRADAAALALVGRDVDRDAYLVLLALLDRAHRLALQPLGER